MVIKEKNLIFRVSPEEKEDFERAANVSGLSLSGWMRQKLRAAAIKELGEIGEKVSFLEKKK